MNGGGLHTLLSCAVAMLPPNSGVHSVFSVESGETNGINICNKGNSLQATKNPAKKLAGYGGNGANHLYIKHNPPSPLSHVFIVLPSHLTRSCSKPFLSSPIDPDTPLKVLFDSLHTRSTKMVFGFGGFPSGLLLFAKELKLSLVFLVRS